MDAKAYLNQYREYQQIADECYNNYLFEVEHIDSIKSSADVDGSPRGKKISRITEDRAIRLADKRELWQNAALDAISIRQAIFEIINKLPSTEADILYHRYILLHTWRFICKELDVSWEKVRANHRRGIALIQTVIDSQDEHIVSMKN